jgi:hypothetical protein
MRFGRRHSQSPGGRSERRDRPGIEGDATAEAIVTRVRQVRWEQLSHAYGPAGDVGPELEALVLGDEATRREAWKELWGNVHHQGTVYDATVPAVEVLADLAGWDEFPDRREALCMLGAFAEGDGSRAGEVGAAVRARVVDLVARWRNEPTLIQRALLVLSRSADVVDQELRESVLPCRYAASWDLGTSGDIRERFGNGEPLAGEDAQLFDAAMDGLSELEDWAFSQD